MAQQGVVQVPERETDKRSQRRQQLREQLDQADKELRDSDWIDRLLVNPDVKRWQELSEEEAKGITGQLEELKRQLCTQPLSSAMVDVVRQKVMLLEQIGSTRRDIFSFLKRESDRLKELTRQLPALQNEYAATEER